MTHATKKSLDTQNGKAVAKKTAESDVKTSLKSQVKATSRGRKVIPPEVTDVMKKLIISSKELINNGCTKMDAAREAFDQLSGYTRSQIIYVFTKGCDLSKAGASTYYQTIKQPRNKGD